jgi:hypothetical protein
METNEIRVGDIFEDIDGEPCEVLEILDFINHVRFSRLTIKQQCTRYYFDNYCKNITAITRTNQKKLDIWKQMKQ